MEGDEILSDPIDGLAGGNGSQPESTFRKSRPADLRNSEWQLSARRFNETAAPYPRHRLVHELFEEQVVQTSDGIALIAGSHRMSYQQLNRAANQLARYLVNEGVRSGAIVGVCIGRRIDMIVGLLAALKVGAAYLPLDPNYPPERLRQMVEDASPSIILTHHELAAALPETSARLLAVDSLLPQIADRVDANLSAVELELTSRNLVYVIYTSGSTGRPKGTEMSHGSMVNLVEWHRRSFPQSQGTRVLQFAALSFDVAFQETFSTLCTGGTLVLLDEWVRRDVRALMQCLNDERIRRLFLPPLMLQSLAEYAISTGIVPGSLQDVITAGEQLRITPEITRLFKQLEGCRLHNHYGPTETHVVTALTLTGDPAQWPALPSIGGPISNTQMYVLDAHREPVPIGVAGEIYIGGVGVARGYLNRPQLTAERFIEDPFSTEPQARLYRTGDLGRWNPDGTLEYLGRNDDQVKIRGYRIELGEIEAQLARHAQVKEAVVLAREDSPGEKRLVAYLTRRGEGELSVEALRLHLKSVLPEHMVPGAFVTLASLPLTPNGKLDRRALPAPDATAYASRDYEAPQGEVEQILAGIWQELLGVERVGRRDNFFELGGHSLLIVQMRERLRRTGLSSEVRSVYASATLADLARTLTGEGAGEFVVPPNLIPAGCQTITPQMLPLVKLEPEHIERIVRAVPGGAANVQDIYPLAPLQEGMLFHHLLNADGGDTYVVPSVFRLSTRERLEEFAAALQAVIDRHDVLRTAILWEQLPQAVQVVYRTAKLAVEEIVLQPHRDSVEQMKERMELAQQRLDLRRAPLISLRVTSEDGGDGWLAMLQLHHLVCDNVSLENMFVEVNALLKGATVYQANPEPYRNHVAHALAFARQRNPEAFFRGKLDGLGEPSAPFGILDVHGSGSSLREAQDTLQPAFARRLRDQARRLGVSSATLFHAAWAVVVSRTSARDDVAFGTVLLGRLQESEGTQRGLGMFINTLPLRLRLDGMTVVGLVEQTQRELAELLDQEQASLVTAQRCSGIDGNTPLFTTLLNYLHNESSLGVQVPQATAGIAVLASQEWTNYPIVVSVEDRTHTFALAAQTDSRIDPAQIIQYMCTSLRSVVAALEDIPGSLAVQLRVLPESEHQLLVNSRKSREPASRSEALIHEMFETQAAHTPGATALTLGDRSITYKELNARANQFAAYLRSRGVGPDGLVALCLERSIDMVVAILGTLKAGGAYVPMDPRYPKERLIYILADANPKLLVLQQSLKAQLRDTRLEVVAIDEDWQEIARHSADNLDDSSFGLRSSNLAYVIYTSGSTGNPKGVMVEHRNVTRLFATTQGLFGFSEQDVWTLFHSFAFDFSVWELWGALLYGGRLVIVPFEIARSPHDFYHLLCSERVTVLNQTPTAFVQLVDAQTQMEHKAHLLRLVIFGGEALEFRTLRPWVRLNGARKPRLVNMYGITETTVHVTFRELSYAEIEAERGSIVGTPIDDLNVYLLDAHGQLVPVGVEGEIYVAGAGVARGYLNRPELTSTRFPADPFNSESQLRMYRSGDLGRWRGDGSLEYLGRNDQQVKIRGYRIELGEIEALLGMQSEVKDAVVLAREEVPGQKQLVAYLIPRDPTAGLPDAEVLRLRLQSTLPEYMIPSAFVPLESLPLTTNGKLDRRSLPTPESDAYASKCYSAPQGELEQVLADIWEALLKRERIGRDDNFFTLGGHSLLAMQAVVRIRASLSLEIPMTLLFEYPTLHQLATQMEKMMQAHLMDRLAVGGAEMEELIDRVAAMPASKVGELMRELEMGARR